ncbi:protein of unknown function DUF192 [Cellulomonas flavigena DSM 20109]|uniref:DUF192 domain-containing protein n=1 Tax=Cellulomonas flavigena (strain ATCC 482 / DSM 20109 / BCRC 11376 / JCM 18109 / NBRC 3775 / NCIMB 8073 / NRS 134) TaxID=446466 RepID=D5UIB5_CELFN|nr:DUF192 domain-containing protein [Cellulomonas flavigena]ADG75460.1 protein of unknown function DUF192 [Cellulomonas flavigena DSM 20109]
MGNPGDRLIVDGREVADLLVADTWARRARGMLARRPLPAAMWFVGETGVHGVGMTRSLDVALLDREGRVVATSVLRPFGMTRPRRGVVDVLEAPRGSFATWGLVPGSVLARRHGVVARVGRS